MASTALLVEGRAEKGVGEGLGFTCVGHECAALAVLHHQAHALVGGVVDHLDQVDDVGVAEGAGDLWGDGAR